MSHQKTAGQHLLRWNPFLRKPNQSLLSPTSAPPDDYNECNRKWCFSLYHRDDHCHTCTVHSTAQFFFFFCSFTDIVFSVIKVQCAFRIKNDNNFKSNSNRQNYSTIWPLPFYEDFSRSPLHPPKFQLHSMGSQRSLRYHTFSQNFHV